MLEEWSRELHKINPLQFEKAVEQLGYYHPRFAPTVYQFRKIALGDVENEFGLNYKPECYRETRNDHLLEDGTRTLTKEQVLENLRAMRKKCGWSGE